MGGPYTVEHKVLHREWDEAVFTAVALFANKAAFTDEDGLMDSYPTFDFEHGSVAVDESWGFTDSGHIYTSSFAEGCTYWSDKHGGYVKSTYGNERELGQLVSASFTLTNDLKSRLAATPAPQGGDA